MVSSDDLSVSPTELYKLYQFYGRPFFVIKLNLI